MTYKNLNNKALLAIILATFIAVACVMLMNASECFAIQVYQDAYARAVVYDDGVSGEIELADESNYVTHSDNKCVKLGKELTSIDGTPLDEIVRFNNNGSVSSFWITHHSRYDIYNIFNPSLHWLNVIHVKGRGPEGFLSGSGLLMYIDDKGNRYDEYLWKHAYSEHCENVLSPSDQPLKIVHILWG